MAYATKEKRNAYARKYQSQPKAKKYKREYFAALPPDKKEAYYKVCHQWHKDNRERDRARMIAYTQSWRAKALEKLGNKCNNPGCGWINTDGSRGCDDKRCLQIDHVHGNGSKDQKSCAPYYKKVFADTKGEYQLLCANCNWIKRMVNKEYKKRS